MLLCHPTWELSVNIETRSERYALLRLGYEKLRFALGVFVLGLSEVCLMLGLLGRGDEVV